MKNVENIQFNFLKYFPNHVTLKLQENQSHESAFVCVCVCVCVRLQFRPRPLEDTLPLSSFFLLLSMGFSLCFPGMVIDMINP